MKNQSFTSAFNQIRNYLAGRAIGITRDEALLHEVVKCLFCKMAFAEDFSNKSVEYISKQYRTKFQSIKSNTVHLFGSDEEILLDPSSIKYVDDVFSRLDLVDPHNDPLSDLYQTFIGGDIRGAEGQFFTPTEAVRWLVEAVAPRKGEKIIDPACGAGSFLSFSARYLRAKGVGNSEINKCLFGIEKDKYLSTLANTHIALTTLKPSNVICGDSIERTDEGGRQIDLALDGSFDVVFANPPFGAKIKIGSEIAKRSFDLAFKWKKDKISQRFVRTDELVNNPSPQILFLELCIRLLKSGGRLGIVVPESLISSGSSSHVVQYLFEKMEVHAVVGMPENLFKTSGKGGTHTKTCLIVAKKRKVGVAGLSQSRAIFMAEAKWCGHDSRGNFIPHNDLPQILSNYASGENFAGRSTLGYCVEHSEINNLVLAPRYYDPAPRSGLASIAQTHDMLLVQDLVDDGVLEFSTGDEIGKLSYGTGSVPFIRTSDISNWEIKTDQKHGVSEEIYQQYSRKQDVQEGDILMVRDGTYLIGTCAYVSKYNVKMIYQSHLFKIRVKKMEVISPYLLLAALSSKHVVTQIQSKRFTQDIIDTIGRRVFELVLPIPKDPLMKRRIEEIVKKSIHDRVEARELARRATILISGDAEFDDLSSINL